MHQDRFVAQPRLSGLSRCMAFVDLYSFNIHHWHMDTMREGSAKTEHV